MLKVIGFSYIPRCCSWCCLYMIWVLGSFTLFVLVVTPFPGKDCYLRSIQKYNDIEQLNTFNTAQPFCSFSRIKFKYKKDDEQEKDICMYCDELTEAHKKRDECHDKFLEQNELTGMSVGDYHRFTCRSGYNEKYIVEEREYNRMVTERMIFLFLFFLYLILPFFTIFIVMIVIYLFYGQCWGVVPTFVCGYCYPCRKKQSDQYNQMYDPGSQYIPTHFVDNNIKPFFKWDPVYIQMKRTWKWYEAECVHWVDRSTKYISKWERRYFTVSGLIVFACVCIMFILLVEKVFVQYLPGILVDCLSPFMNIFVTWNAIIFIFFIVFKISVIRVITNKRAIRFFRVPLFGLICQYVLFEDCDNVIEIQNWIYLENKDSNRKVCIFRTASPISCTTAIREFIERERRFRERDVERDRLEMERRQQEREEQIRRREERLIERDRLRNEMEQRERELDDLRDRARDLGIEDFGEGEEEEFVRKKEKRTQVELEESGDTEEEEEEGITSHDEEANEDDDGETSSGEEEEEEEDEEESEESSEN